MNRNKANKEEGQEHHRDISIWLDEYDDIFSDFDSRPYYARILSDDFISEVNKVSKETDLDVHELKLLMPEKLRSNEKEAVITERLHYYFKTSFQHRALLRRKTILRAFLILTVGLCLMLLASYIRMDHDTFAINLLFVILEPAGWFLVWTGFEELFFKAKKKAQELEFYSKMARSTITFVSIK